MGEQHFSCTTDNEEIFKKRIYYATDKFKETLEESKNFNTLNHVVFQKRKNDEATIKVIPYTRQEILCKKSKMKGMGKKGSYFCASEIYLHLPPKPGNTSKGLKYFNSLIHFWPKDKFLLVEIDEEFKQVNNSVKEKSIRIKNDYNTQYIYRAKCD